MKAAPAGPGQPRQDLEVVETEAVSAPQFLVQLADNPGIGIEERTPGTKFELI